MKKIALTLIAAATLSACVEGGSNVAVSQSGSLSMSCASVHMQTINGLPMRCGPQAAKPYTLQ